MAEKDADLEKLKKIVEMMKAHDLSEVQLEREGEKIVLKRGSKDHGVPMAVPMMGGGMPMVAGAGAAAGAGVATGGGEEAGAGAGLVEIKSPMVGTFYATPSPDSEPYVEVGSHVSEGTVVCIVEAMKVMNEIKAETMGTIAEVCAKSGQAVEFGQVLFRVRPD